MNAFGPLLRRRDERRKRRPPVVEHRQVGLQLRAPPESGARVRPRPHQAEEPAVAGALREAEAGPAVVAHPRVGDGGVREEEPVISSRQVVMQQC